MNIYKNINLNDDIFKYGLWEFKGNLDQEQIYGFYSTLEFIYYILQTSRSIEIVACSTLLTLRWKNDVW